MLLSYRFKNTRLHFCYFTKKKISRIYVFLLFLTLLVTSLYAEESATLHAIVVLDQDALNIQKVVAANQVKIHTFLEDIIQYTELHLNQRYFLAEKGTCVDIYDYLQALTIKPDDIVLFYFSGHGFRTLSKQNPWPNLYLTADHRGLDYEEILTILNEKNPRFFLALADCCNNLISEQFAPSLYSAFALMRVPPQTNLKDKYQKLFLTFKGKIAICSAFEGEFSWGTIKGGLFTLSLLETLNDPYDQDHDWEKLLEKASDKVIQHQTPFYQIALTPDNTLIAN